MVKPLVTAPAHDFLRRGIASRDESLMHVDRVIYLAEYLTRLSTVRNFDEKVKDLRNYGLEETFYELRVARSLQKRDRLVKFVVPSSVRGQDFDLEARLDTEPLAVEVKCLTDEPDLTTRDQEAGRVDIQFNDTSARLLFRGQLQLPEDPG